MLRQGANFGWVLGLERSVARKTSRQDESLMKIRRLEELTNSREAAKGFVSGHGFSRAGKVQKTNRASARPSREASERMQL
jgi:hypothetical protein